MSKLIVALIAGMVVVGGAAVYAADTTSQTDSKKSVKALGRPCTPGAGDSSAHMKGPAQGGDVKCAPEASAKEPGRTGDPASPEKKK